MQQRASEQGGEFLRDLSYIIFVCVAIYTPSTPGLAFGN